MSFKQLENRIGGAQVNYHFNFSIKRRYLYVQNSKCACTYLKSSLSLVELADSRFFEEGYQYTNPRIVVPDALGKNPHQPVNRSVFVKPYQLGVAAFDGLLSAPGYFKFTVVRNPYARALSAYLDTVKRDRLPFQELKPELAAVKAMPVLAVSSENVSFADFLRAIELRVQAGGWKAVDQHYRAQGMHISDDIISYSKIFRLERFPEAIDEISQHLGARLPEGKKGAHATDSDSKLAQYFEGSECRELVRRIYRNDLERFDYDFPVT